MNFSFTKDSVSEIATYGDIAPHPSLVIRYPMGREPLAQRQKISMFIQLSKPLFVKQSANGYPDLLVERKP